MSTNTKRTFAAFEYVADPDDAEQVAMAAARAALGVLLQAVRAQRDPVQLGEVLIISPDGTPSGLTIAPLYGLVLGSGVERRHAVLVTAVTNPKPAPEPAPTSGEQKGVADHG